MSGLALVVALGTAISFLLSTGALAISVFSLVRPQRDLDKLSRRLTALGGLETEWANVQTSLDSMIKRLSKVQRDERAERPAAQRQEPTPDNPRDARAAILKRAPTFQSERSA